MTKSMPKLSDASEKAISEALHKVAELVEQGSDPTDAIVKVATDTGIQAGHVRLMVRAYNNGKSVSHIKTHDKLEEKAASFPLADASTVLERMFPSHIKTASERATDEEVSEEYDRSPADWLKRRDASIKKAAVQRVDLKAAYGLVAPPLPTNPEMPVKRALAANDRLRKEAATKYHAALHAGYAVADTVDALTAYFKQADSLGFERVRYNVGEVLGRPATKLMDKIASELPKRAKHGSAPHTVNWDAPPYSLVKAALTSVQEFKGARAAHDTFQKEASAKIAENMRPFAQSPAKRVITGSVWVDQSQTEKSAEGIDPGEMVSAGIGSALAGGAKDTVQRFGPMSKNELANERMKDIGTPAHDDVIKGIQTQMLLHDMMLNDPVLSGYHPEQVMDAYNKMSELAPVSMQRRILAQSMLRKYLAQGQAIDAFDIDQLMTIEKNMRTQLKPVEKINDIEPDV